MTTYQPYPYPYQTYPYQNTAQYTYPPIQQTPTQQPSIHPSIQQQTQPSILQEPIQQSQSAPPSHQSILPQQPIQQPPIQPPPILQQQNQLPIQQPPIQQQQPIYQQYQKTVKPKIHLLQHKIKSLQTSNTNVNLLIKLALLAGASYLIYKFVWTPYSIKSERESCIKSCYAKAERREREQEEQSII